MVIGKADEATDNGIQSANSSNRDIH